MMCKFLHGIAGYQKLIYKNYRIDQVAKMAGIVMRVSWDIRRRVGKAKNWGYLYSGRPLSRDTRGKEELYNYSLVFQNMGLKLIDRATPCSHARSKFVETDQNRQCDDD